MSTSRRLLLLVALAGAFATAAGPAWAAPQEPPDQIVLSGRVEVERGEVVGEVVVFHGNVTVSGVVRGDVVVLDGRISVFGQVSGTVVNLNGPVLLGPNAHVRGDVLARDAVEVRPGATVDGRIREGAAFTFRTPVRALGRFAGWLVVTVSTLLLGLLLILIAPRGADAVFEAARTAPWASIGWGVAAFVGLPVLGVLATVTLVGLGFGLGLLLALAFAYLTAYAWGVWALGRAIFRGNRALAFLIGWGIARGVALIPFAGWVTWLAGAVFGLGAVTVATWRARRTPGKHRVGQAAVRPV